MTEVRSQLKFAPQSTKSKIANALLAVLGEIKSIKYLSFDQIKLQIEDFKEDEIPAVQLIDQTESIVHVRGEAQRTWSITLELVHKSTENGYINQQDIWNLEYQIARKIWATPNLGVKGVQHCKYVSNTTDLHLLYPFYLLRMDFDVLYYEPLVSEC